jgi:excisionase family DNA binding protein
MEPITADNDILTVDEIAALLRVPRGFVLSAIRRGELPAKKFGNKWGYRVQRAAYEEWLAAWQSRKPAQP